MKKNRIITIMIFVACHFSMQAADVTDETRHWAEVPFSKCATIPQKMKCVFSQQICKRLEPATQEEIKQKRIQNRTNPDYALPTLGSQDTQITPAKTAIFLQLVKTKAIDTE